MASREQRLLARHKRAADSERKMTPTGGVTLVGFVLSERLNVYKRRYLARARATSLMIARRIEIPVLNTDPALAAHYPTDANQQARPVR